MSRAKIEYPKDWNEALQLGERLKREVKKDFDVEDVVMQHWYNEYYTICFVMCRYTQKHKFVPYIKEKYGLEFMYSEYCHITMFDAYSFKLNRS